jgi:hypothetical protein
MAGVSEETIHIPITVTIAPLCVCSLGCSCRRMPFSPETRVQRAFRLVRENPTAAVFLHFVQHVLAHEATHLLLEMAHVDPEDPSEMVGLLTLCVKALRPDLVRMLLVDLRMIDQRVRESMVMVPTKKTAPTSGAVVVGGIALHKAVQFKDLESATVLLQHAGGRQVLHKDGDGRTPLYLAVTRGGLGHLDEDAGLEIVKALLQYEPVAQVRQQQHA